MSTPSDLEAELDLAILDMDNAITEGRARSILANISGVLSARLHECGALIKYRPARVNKDTICDHLRKAGFQPTIFQDSATGITGSVAY